MESVKNNEDANTTTTSDDLKNNNNGDLQQHPEPAVSDEKPIIDNKPKRLTDLKNLQLMQVTWFLIVII